MPARRSMGMYSPLTERREFDEPHAVAEAVEQIGRDLQGEARLADAARADQRDETMLLDQRGDFGDLRLAADEGRDLQRQIVGETFERSQRREVGNEIGCEQLIDVLGAARGL